MVLRLDTVIPFPMEIMRSYLYPFHFFVRNLNLGWIFSPIQLRFDLKPRAGSRFSNQLHNNLMTSQGATPPVHTNMGKESMLDLIPFACPGREVADRDPQACLGGKVLQFNFPQTDAVPITSPAIGTNQHIRGPGVDLLAHRKPPAADTGHRETRRIVVHTDIDPAHVLADIIHAIRNYLGKSGGGKIMISTRSGFPAGCHS